MLDTTKDDGFDLVRAQLSLDAPFPDIIYFWDVASWYIRYGTYLVPGTNRGRPLLAPRFLLGITGTRYRSLLPAKSASSILPTRMD